MDCKLFILLAVTVVGTWAAPGITGGGTAVDGEFPYQAAIYVNGDFVCSGAIVDTKKIVTVAHCVTEGNTNNSLKVTDVQVLVNSLDNTATNKLLHVSKIVVNPEYDHDTRAADLAVLIIDDSLYSSKDASIEAFTNSTAPTLVTVTGWGKQDKDKDASTQLQYGTLTLVSSDTCKSSSKQGSNSLTNDQLCYMNEDSKTTNPCSGDDGDPIVSSGQLIGLEIYGGGCQDPVEPSIFVEVYPYRDWISKTNGAGSSQLGIAAVIFLIFSIVRLN